MYNFQYLCPVNKLLSARINMWMQTLSAFNVRIFLFFMVYFVLVFRYLLLQHIFSYFNNSYIKTFGLFTLQLWLLVCVTFIIWDFLLRYLHFFCIEINGKSFRSLKNNVLFKLLLASLLAFSYRFAVISYYSASLSFYNLFS